MPKVSGTRKERAVELLQRAETGPCLGLTSAFIADSGLSRNQVLMLQTELKTKYRLWAQTWLVPNIKQLVPELRALKNQGNENENSAI